jgi:hypothetical protein
LREDPLLELPLFEELWKLLELLPEECCWPPPKLKPFGAAMESGTPTKLTKTTHTPMREYEAIADPPYHQERIEKSASVPPSTGPFT